MSRFFSTPPKHLLACSLLLAISLAALYAEPAAQAAAPRVTPVTSVHSVFTRCRQHPGSKGQVVARIRVRGFSYILVVPGGHAVFSVLFDRKLRPGVAAYRSVRIPLGSGKTALGVVIRAGGLVVAWPGGGPYPPSQTPPPEPPVNGSHVVVHAQLICRGLHDDLSPYFVNGRGQPYLVHATWTKA